MANTAAGAEQISVRGHQRLTPSQQHLARRPSVEARLAMGKALRATLPRGLHAEYVRSPGRKDPVATLEAQARTRLPKVVPIRYARMLASPFAFLRGSAAVMAGDLARTRTTGIPVQACGDVHVANFGVFASAERHLVFGINDFDETLPGPWEWDLKRLAASAVVAQRCLGADKILSEEAARAVVRSYRVHMREYAEMGHLDVWYTRIDEGMILDALPRKVRRAARKVIAKARRRTHLQVLDRMTDLVDGRHHIREAPPFVVRETRTVGGQPIKKALELFLQGYVPSLPDDRKPLLARYRILDVARKVVGVGSVGMHCWVIFLQGNDPADPLFLQIKQAQPSVLEPYWGKSAHSNHGQRVVVGQRIIQGAPDILLGWGTYGDVDYYVRQLRDMMGGLRFDPDKTEAEDLVEYCGLCGWALALAHAKSGNSAIIAGYLGKSEATDEAIARFAAAYADQTERDHEALAEAARQGRIRVAHD
jgi:uncharacterized protein (DUF2252 family)